jgi:hypothetical protein
MNEKLVEENGHLVNELNNVPQSQLHMQHDSMEGIISLINTRVKNTQIFLNLMKKIKTTTLFLN